MIGDEDEDEALIDAPLSPEIKVATQTGSENPNRAVTSTHMSPMAPAEAASHHRRAAIGTSPATGPANAAVPPQADQYLPSDATAEDPEGPARTTVTVLDLDPSIPAIPPAHHSPKEIHHPLAPALPCALVATPTDLIEIAMPAPSAVARTVTATAIVPMIVTTPADAAVQAVVPVTPHRRIMMQSALAL